MASIREKILAAKARRREPVPAKQAAAFGLSEGELFVAGATAADVGAWLAATRAEKGPGGKLVEKPDVENRQARLLVACLVDEQWRYVLRPEDVKELGELPNEVISPLYATALRLSGLTQDDDEGGDGEKNAVAATPSA